jgi:hypothetical protein
MNPMLSLIFVKHADSGHVGFLIVLCSVMVSRLVLFGATMKPRASCGAWHKVVLLGTRWYQGC